MNGPPFSRRRGPRRLTEDELALWRRVAAEVSPLPDREDIGHEEGAPSPSPPPAPLPPLPLPPPLPPASDEPGIGLDRRQAQRLRRGKMEIEGRLDLHGHTQDSGRRALDAFIAGSYASGRRCVLVVTGKGTRGEGVMRTNVPRWLNESPNRARVLAVATAQPRDGGSGALYVLLRRARS